MADARALNPSARRPAVRRRLECRADADRFEHAVDELGGWCRPKWVADGSRHDVTARIGSFSSSARRTLQMS